jgi:hypothetical protein
MWAAPPPAILNIRDGRSMADGRRQMLLIGI